MSIETAGNKMTRSDRTLICGGFCDACEGQALALRAAPVPCRSGSPDPDLFVIRRSQTTHPGYPANPGHPASDGTRARDRPSRYGHRGILFRCLARDRPSRYGYRGAWVVSSCGGRHAYINAMQVFLHRLPCPHNRALILAILSILAILLQTRERLRSSRTFSPDCADVL